jgi:hypothetical protein
MSTTPAQPITQETKKPRGVRGRGGASYLRAMCRKAWGFKSPPAHRVRRYMKTCAACQRRTGKGNTPYDTWAAVRKEFRP